MNVSYKKMTVGISAAVLLLLFSLSIYQMTQDVMAQAGQTIVDDIAHVQNLLHKIHEDCTILEFDHDRNYVDFLTIVRFEGPYAGSMYLANPNGWHGPYAVQSPACQTIVYEIIRTAQGYYLVPGAGVRLPDGRTVGQEVLSHANQADWHRELASLVWRGVNLYAPVTVQMGAGMHCPVMRVVSSGAD